MIGKRNRNRRERGQAMVEVTLLAPWIFFLFIGITDFGFYAYSAICTQNAARAAAIQTAAAAGAQLDSIACNAALNELNWLPNVVALNLTTCAPNAASITATAPVAVQRQTLCGASTPNTITCSALPTSPTCADCLLDTKAASSQVAVTYQSGLFVNIPGILTNQLTLTRVMEARIIAE